MAADIYARRSSLNHTFPARVIDTYKIRRASCLDQLAKPLAFDGVEDAAIQLLTLLDDYKLRRDSEKTAVTAISPEFAHKLSTLLSVDACPKGGWNTDFSFARSTRSPSLGTVSTAVINSTDSLSDGASTADQACGPDNIKVSSAQLTRPANLALPLPCKVALHADISSDTSDEKNGEEQVLPCPSRWSTIRKRCKAWLQTHYIVIDTDPALLLASPPSDDEKVAYADSHRFALCTMALVTFLCSSAGVWLFVVCGNIFYWFGAFFVIGQLSFALFQLSSAMARGFSLANHAAVVQTHAVAVSDMCPQDKVAATPTVDVYLPCCKEPIDVLENTYVYVQKLEYPKSKLHVHVLDDGRQDEVRDLAHKYGFNYIRRSNGGHLKKAGNLRNAFAETTGDFFAIFDADFCPRSDFLLETIPRMKSDDRLGILQTPQYFRTMKQVGMQTWVERGAGATQEVFYRLIQTCRDTWGAVICAGSCALYRREALQKLGGTAPLESSEDIFTGFYLTLDGWKVNYLPLNLSCGICPNTARAYYSQQLRWCEGSCSLVLAKEFWLSKLNWKAKVLYVSGLLYYTDHALAPFILPLTAILMIWFKINALTIYNLAFAIPSTIFGYWLSRFWSTAKHAKSVQFVNVLQSYAYASALLDRILGTTYAWVPSGDAKAHKSHRYRNSRWLCIAYTFATTAALVSGIVYQVIAGHPMHLFVPIIALQLFTIHTTLPFMLAVH